MSKSIPTERVVLRTIYDMYEAKFIQAGESTKTSYIAIDVPDVAEKLGCDKNLLFGYLYYYLEQKHRYQTSSGIVSLFAKQVGNIRNGINFGYLAAILAHHDQEHSKYKWSLMLSLVALALSVGAIVAQLVSSA